MLTRSFAGVALCLAAITASADTVAPIPVQAFFSYPKVSSAEISPDGKYLAMVVSDDDTGEDQKFLAIIGSDDRKMKTGFKVADGLEIWRYWWANSERVLIATATQTGALSAATPDGSLYAINVDKTQSLQLLGRKPTDQPSPAPSKPGLPDPTKNFTHIVTRPHPKASTSSTFFFNGMVYIPDQDGKHVLVQGWEEGKSRLQALDVDVYSGDVQVVTESPTGGGDFLADKDGKIRLAWGEDPDTGDPQLFYRDATDSAKWRDLSLLYKDIDTGEDDSDPLRMSQDGNTFYWWGRADGGTMGVFSVNPANMEKRLLYAEPGFDVDGFLFGDYPGNQDKLLAVETFPGLPEFHVIDQKDPETAVLLALREAFPAQQVFVTSATRDGSLMVVYVGSDKNPGDYYLFNVKTLKADYLFSTLDQIDPDKMASMQPVTFKARDGLVLHGYLTTPPGQAAKDLPLILLPHGGPHTIRDYWGWNPEAQFFASHGYAVLQVNFRGSGGYGMQFQDLGYRNWGTVMQDDLADSVRWAEQQGIADPGRVCIYGASYGGYAALENVIRYPALYKCAVGYVGVYDLTLQGKYSDTERSASGRHYLDVVLGHNTNDLKRYSPVYHADEINVPVLIAYGGRDQRVVPDNAKELMDAMDQAGKKYEVIFDPYEDHGFKKPEHRFELYTKMLAFMDKYIGPDAGHAAAAPATTLSGPSNGKPD